ncbi:MAG: hypothetical protein AAGF11_10305 [Myxococcota bacterium]
MHISSPAPLLEPEPLPELLPEPEPESLPELESTMPFVDEPELVVPGVGVPELDSAGVPVVELPDPLVVEVVGSESELESSPGQPDRPNIPMVAVARTSEKRE